MPKTELLNETNRKHSGGWTEDEQQLLFSAAAKCREEGRALSEAFRHVAAATGRKPNSVRNRYYMSLDRCEIKHGERARFIPFTSEEVRALMRSVLIAKARGESVRSCALELGKGKNAAMLRYQNKYRSVLKHDPELVKSVIKELESEGVAVFDPYSNEKTLAKTADEDDLNATFDTLKTLKKDQRDFIESCLRLLVELSKRLK